MDWEKLFTPHILDRGYNYYCENAVKNLDISEDEIRADVLGTEVYEVEISLEEGEVTDMVCSCPYAEQGRNCKHMAAVLYEWSEAEQEDGSERADSEEKDVFTSYEAIYKLVEEADISVVRSYLSSILAEDEKLLVRFHTIVSKKVTNEDIQRYKKQIADIADRYLGRERFISYHEANGFISELEDILEEDVRRMMDNHDYMSAFEVMNYIFVLVGEVDMDDSDGGSGMVAESIYELWLELLDSVSFDEKQEMFQWFTTHLDGSVIDYLEEYMEQILMEGFDEKEFEQPKFHFIEDRLHSLASKEEGWSRRYAVGKWAVRYLDMLEKQKDSQTSIEEFCSKYWDNSSVRKYYIDRCVKKQDYGRALEVLEESISLDKEYKGLVSEYSKRKKELYLLQGNQEAYVKQLWKLILEHAVGDMDLYRELKRQYQEEEWLEKREEIFKNLSGYAHVERFYKEEKMYDRLLEFVMNTTGLYVLQEYENVLKNEYPKEILEKYKRELSAMAAYASDRKKYQQIVSVLSRMQEIKGGPEIVSRIVAEWKERFRNRPAMMDELKKLERK